MNATPNQNIEQQTPLFVCKDGWAHKITDGPGGQGCDKCHEFLDDLVSAYASKQVSEARVDELESLTKGWMEDFACDDCRHNAHATRKRLAELKQTPPTPNGDEQGASANPSTPTALSKQADNLDVAMFRVEKFLYDLFYKGLEVGSDLQYQFERDLGLRARYIERCLKDAKGELADILTSVITAAKNGSEPAKTAPERPPTAPTSVNREKE